jgi:hypothetical protein
MDTTRTRNMKRNRFLRRLVLALGVAALAGGIATAPARADDDHWHHGHDGRRDHRGHERRDHHWREHHPYVVGAYPGYAYGYPPPPPVVYAPPPVVYAPPVYAPAPAVSFVFPLHIH